MGKPRPHYLAIAEHLKKGTRRRDIYRQVSEEYGISYNGIWQICQRYFPREKINSPEDVERLLQEYLDSVKRSETERNERFVQMVESLTPEQRSEMSKKGWNKLSESEKRQRLEASIQSEASIRSISPEQRSEAAKRYWAGLTEAEKRRRLEETIQSVTPEQRSETAKRYWAGLSEEEKRELVQKSMLSVSPKQRMYRRGLTEKLGRPLRTVLEESLKSNDSGLFLLNLGIRPADLWKAGFDTETVTRFFPIEFLIGIRN